MVFDSYARYYNLLYKEKDYKAEAAHVHYLIEQFTQNQAENILDVGCGTGNHAACMTGFGYNVTGVDLSPEMIRKAIERQIPNTEFHIGNATSFNLSKKFDVVTSLFHVLSYQTTNNRVIDMMQRAYEHLTDSGVFIFDFWYGPAVLTEKPSIRVKRLEDDVVHVTRISEPVLKVNQNMVDVNFDLLIRDKQTNKMAKINEVHPMRYFFKPEIELLLSIAGMHLVYFKEWVTGKEPSENSWGVCCVAVKNLKLKNASATSLL